MPTSSTLRSKEPAMPFRRLLQSPRARRGVAISAVVLSLGGLVLFRTPAVAQPTVHGPVSYLNGTTFGGPGASGSFALSHGKILADGRQRLFAELRLRAEDAAVDAERAPLAMVVMLDTSGSMDGEKIREAQRSVVELIRNMRDDDQIALVRYDSSAELIQPMARVGSVRSSLIARIQRMEAGGGTNIPAALRQGTAALRDASPDRVQRLVLVSDGLDSTRSEAEQLARSDADLGATVSTLGIGLDFDEAYMSSVAEAGRGNFAFVENASALSRFLDRELVETAATTVERATARIQLPAHLRFVRAVGAEVRQLGDGAIELKLGSLHSGDERRVALELEADAPFGADLPIDAQVAWQQVGGEHTRVDLERLALATTDDPQLVAAARDPRVYGSCLSALASVRQMEAAQAYARGDTERAQQLIESNLSDLDDAAAEAPEDVAGSLAEQAKTYRATQGEFAAAAPRSDEGRAAAKRATAQDSANLGRAAY
jgi:Ca-activated chloride channel family protein